MNSIDEKCAKRIIRHFQQENAKLKAVVIDKDMEIGRLVAKLHNIEEGLKKGPDMDGVGLGAEPSYRYLWDRNNVLKAKLHNIEEGISRLGEFIAKQKRSKAALKNILAFDFDREIYTLADWTGFEIYTAPTMPDLIAAILTGGK